jgi:glucosamine--fructose-6-phosphate aminotransferase (isomerizing)
MCGIIGYIGKKEAVPILLDCIRKLEYRGYDSVGMVVCSDKGFTIKKDIGKIEEVHTKINFLDMKGLVGLAHSRWSTHGGVTKANAHPHTDCSGCISLVHNGIIENYAELKKGLVQRGHCFASETDTEVIAHLIEENYQGNLKEATLKVLQLIEGSYALGVMCTKEPNVLVAARNESPLVIGLGTSENFIASDVPAILQYTREVIYLENKEIAVLTTNGISIFDIKGHQLDKKSSTITWNSSQAEKSGFDHFMLKEIYEQPIVISETLVGKITDKTIDLNHETGITPQHFRKIKRIIIVACGTSWHASLVGEFMLEELAKIPVEVEYASEFRYRDPIIEKGTLIIAVSQSGETADTLAAIREAKKKSAKILSIVNVVGSSIARESDFVVYTKAGPEIGVASTKAFTSQLVVLYILTVYLGSLRGYIDEHQLKNRIRDIRKLPLQMQNLLEEIEIIKSLAEKFYTKTNALYLGRGINYPIALEGALKLKEVSYVHAEGYPAAEMKHGPIALIDKHMPVVFIATKDLRTYSKILSNIQEVKSRGGIIIAIASKGDGEIKNCVDHVIYVPQNSYILTPLLAVIPLQVFAYYVAIKRGIDPDKPKNLAKSVTVE